MNSTRNQYTVTILGEKLTVLSDENESMVAVAASTVEKNLKEILERSPALDTHKAAIFVALRATSALLACESLLDSRTRTVTSYIDRLLSE